MGKATPLAAVDPAVEGRILDALEHHEPDRVPVWEAIENRAVYDHFAPGESSLLRAAAAACAALGIDMTYGCMKPPAADSAAVTERDDATVTEAGQTVWTVPRRKWTVQDIIDYRPESIRRADIEERYVADFRALREAYAPRTMYVSQGGGFGFIFGYDTARFEAFAYALHECPDQLERIWDVHMANAIIRNSIYADHRLGPVIQLCEDVAFNGRLMVSPDLLRAQFFPRLREVIRPLKEAGIKTILHSDGDITEVLDDVVACGIDGINPVEPAAGMDIGWVKRHYGDRLILVGNVDSSRVMPFGTPNDVRRDVARCIAEASPGGGHFVQCGSGELPPDVPLANVVAYFDAIREFGRYPIRVPASVYEGR